MTKFVCQLNSTDPATGLTPMLQAIYANHVEVVKELMMAGALNASTDSRLPPVADVRHASSCY